MISEKPKIVVITPVKNEEWILRRFLQVTSQFADHIIIADQGSTDKSVEICLEFPKVKLIQNSGAQYDEGSRQLLLIRTARELVEGPRIILALDADEILAANAMSTASWQTIFNAKPGTVLLFEKPDLYISPQQCIRYLKPWPLGYVDDGAEHKPSKIHSIRIPTPDYAVRYEVYGIKILHYGFARMQSQFAKHRLYSVLENVIAKTNFSNRRFVYGEKIERFARGGKIQSCPQEWFAKWEELGIDMQTIPTSKYYWQDFEVLRHFKEYGCRKFWSEDIWYFDWEACRLYAKEQGIPGIPNETIVPPPRYLRQLYKAGDVAYSLYRRFRFR